MQLYPNERQINLTQYEKDKFHYIYEKLGGRYIRINWLRRELIIYNDENKAICTSNIEIAGEVYNMLRKATTEISIKDGPISIEKIINKFCK